MLNVDFIRQEVLLMDVLYWESEDDTSLLPTWNNLTSLDFSHNNISSVDQSIVSGILLLFFLYSCELHIEKLVKIFLSNIIRYIFKGLIKQNY